MCRFGIGRSALEASCHSVASTDNSPRREEITRPRYEDEVTKINIGLPGGQRSSAPTSASDSMTCSRVPESVLGEALLQGGEAQLAGVADEHHPAGDSDDVVGLFAGVQAAPPLADLAQRVGPRNRDGVGLAALGEQPGPLVLPHPDLLGSVGIRRSGVFGTASASGAQGSWVDLETFER